MQRQPVGVWERRQSFLAQLLIWIGFEPSQAIKEVDVKLQILTGSTFAAIFTLSPLDNPMCEKVSLGDVDATEP